MTTRMRQAARELCRQIDELRKDRKTALVRHYYLNAPGKEEEAAAVLQRIEAIDAKIAPLHAQAKERLITGITTDLSQGAALLKLATTDAQKIRTSMVEENQRHGAAMSKLIAAQQELDRAFHEGVSTMESAAVMLTNGDEEQVSKTEAGDAIPAPARSSTDTKKSSPARSSSDMKCPHCTLNCNGTKGLATHPRNCKKRIDVEQAPGAEEAVDSKFPCPKCAKKYGTKASLRTHQYRCKGPSGDKPASAPPAAQAPLADTICPLCSKVCKGTRSLATHSRNCKGVAGAAGNVDAAAAPAKRRRQSKPKEQTGAASAGAAEAVAASAGAAETAEAGHQLSTPEEQPVVNAPLDQQPGGGPAPYQLPVDQAPLHSTVQLVVAEQEKSNLTAMSIRVSAVRDVISQFCTAVDSEKTRAPYVRRFARHVKFDE